MNFFTTLIDGLTAKQKGGLFAIFGGILLSGLGLAAMSDAHLQIGPNGLDFDAK